MSGDSPCQTPPHWTWMVGERWRGGAVVTSSHERGWWCHHWTLDWPTSPCWWWWSLCCLCWWSDHPWSWAHPEDTMLTNQKTVLLWIDQWEDSISITSWRHTMYWDEARELSWWQCCVCRHWCCDQLCTDNVNCWHCSHRGHTPSCNNKIRTLVLVWFDKPEVSIKSIDRPMRRHY